MCWSRLPDLAAGGRVPVEDEAEILIEHTARAYGVRQQRMARYGRGRRGRAGAGWRRAGKLVTFDFE
jgi:hypothetical protein